MSARLLLVGVPPALADDLSRVLSADGYSVHAAFYDRTVLSTQRTWRPHLVVADVDGLAPAMHELTRALSTTIPALFLSGGQDSHGLRGLPVTGNDCVTTPFSLEELAARIRRLGRESRLPGHTTGRYAISDLELDEETFEVTRAGRPIQLSATEFRLLRCLIRHPGQTIPRRQLLDRVWDYHYTGRPGVLDTYVGYLRRKVDAGVAPLLHTVRNHGYRLG